MKGEIEMNMKIHVFTKRLDALVVSPSINVANTYTVNSCSICASPMHSTQILHLHRSFLSIRWNKQTLSMTTESSKLDLTLRHMIRDGGTIQTFRGSKIREEHLRMLKPIILPNFRHNSTISLRLKCLLLHLN